ncbi:hypothetical protein C8A05DRAFT_14621 [Staphylotrichum tortipilum]|uniref:AAA+ ATPase domain-containing protein n=1 Tax=Staphylotrichum tortipilum TaxID=2831512 RepID=A0AAN6MN27_9PEZI|nr:hypothetical protein C8A05DRAFT_14621 [Staphylotrichum longicolle]
MEVAEGSSCSIQTLYEGKSKCNCCKNWVVDYPEDLRVAVEDQLEAKQKALVLRMGKNHGADGGKPLVLDSVVIQNTSLKKTLCEVFEGFKGITPSLKKLVFRAPFKPFHHRWARFTEILERQKTEDPAAAAYTQLLYDVLDTEIRDVRAEVADLLDNGVITYPLLWALFEPGMTVFGSLRGHDRFLVVDSRDYDHQHNYFAVMARSIDWDGHRFGFMPEAIKMPSFAGTRNITELACFPAPFHPNLNEAEASAIARGRAFERLAGIHYAAYSGVFAADVLIERQLSGRVVVDAAGSWQSDSVISDHVRPFNQTLSSLDSGPPVPQIEVSDDTHDPNSRPYPIPRRRRSSASEIIPWGVRTVTDQAETKNQPLTRTQLLLCAPTVRGYSLKLQQWGFLSATGITPITFNDAAFPNLMLPPTYKELILSFPAVPAAVSPPPPKFDDLIQGKGLGVILLLVGNPGTGKTLTAEAVADKVRRPLYVLSAGELGQMVHDVENRLRNALDLAERWGAVLLLDECDVFLQERSPGVSGGAGTGTWDLARNEVVAVFLRLLEYYRGILFMTTNRQETLDRAFHSRVHLTLQYPDLDEPAKEHIWRHFTKVAGAGKSFTAEIYADLAKVPLNGREIKNTVKIASLVATRLGEPFKVGHVRTALAATRGMEGE